MAYIPLNSGSKTGPTTTGKVSGISAYAGPKPYPITKPGPRTNPREKGAERIGQSAIADAMISTRSPTRTDRQGYFSVPRVSTPTTRKQSGPRPGLINWATKDYGPADSPGKFYHPLTGEFLGWGRENRYDWANDPDGAKNILPDTLLGAAAPSSASALGVLQDAAGGNSALSALDQILQQSQLPQNTQTNMGSLQDALIQAQNGNFWNKWGTR